jgi:hypothetical protein
MFLANACRLKARVKQLHFTGAFLQAKTRNRIVTLPKIFGNLFPKCTKYNAWTALSSKYWYLDLLEYLLEIKFNPGQNVPCLFISCDGDINKIYMLNYIDDMLYFGTSDVKVRSFDEKLKK